MEQSEEYLGVGIKIKALEQQLSLCVTAVNVCNESAKDVEKEIEEHFAKCINALAERKAILVKELARKVTCRNKSIEDTRVKIETAIAVCQETLQLGSKGYSISSSTADVIWKGIQGIPTLRVSSVRMNANLPMMFFDIVRNHGEVGDTSRFSEAERITTLIGPSGLSACVKDPWGICFNPRDLCLYISDRSNKTIKKLTAQGNVSIFANRVDGSPSGIVMNYEENCFYIGTYDAHSIVKLSSSGIVSRFVGSGQPGRADGFGVNASFNNPLGIAIDQQSGDLFVNDEGSNLIRKVTPQGEVSTLAGSKAGDADGDAKAARFNSLRGICFDENSRSLLVCDYGNNKLRRVQLNGDTTTLCEIQDLACVAVTANQTILVTTTDHFLYKVTHQGLLKYGVEALAGSGKDARVDGGPQECCFNSPRGLAVHEKSHSCFVADRCNQTIRKVSFVPPN